MKKRKCVGLLIFLKITLSSLAISVSQSTATPSKITQLTPNMDQRITDNEQGIKDQAARAEGIENKLQTSINDNKAQQDQINTNQGNTNNGLRTDVDKNKNDISSNQQTQAAINTSQTNTNNVQTTVNKGLRTDVDKNKNDISSNQQTQAAINTSQTNTNNVQTTVNKGLRTDVDKNKNDISSNQQTQAAINTSQTNTNNVQTTVNKGLRTDVDKNTDHIKNYQTQLTNNENTMAANTAQLANNSKQLEANKDSMDEFHTDFTEIRKDAVDAKILANSNKKQIDTNTQGIATLQTGLSKKANQTDLKSLATKPEVAQVAQVAHTAAIQAQTNADVLKGFMGKKLSAQDVIQAHEAMKLNTQDIEAIQGIVDPKDGSTYANGQFAQDVQSLKTHIADIHANAVGIGEAKDEAAKAFAQSHAAEIQSTANAGKISTLEAKETDAKHRLTKNEKDISSLQTDVVSQGEITKLQDERINGLQDKNSRQDETISDFHRRLSTTENGISNIQTQLADKNNGLDSKSSKDQTTEGMTQIVGATVRIDSNGHVISGVDGSTIKNLKDLTTGQSVNAQAIKIETKRAQKAEGKLGADIKANTQSITDNKDAQDIVNIAQDIVNTAQTTATSNEVSRAKTAEEANQKQITDNKNSQNVINTKHENLIGANTTATSNEVSRAKTAEEVNQKQITDNKNSQNVINTKHENLIGANTTATSNEVSRAKTAEEVNQKQITDNKNSQNVINTKHENLIGANTTATSNEVSRAKTAEEVNQKQITDNKNSQNVINTKHENLIGANTTATSNEVIRAKDAESINAKKIAATSSQVNNIGTLTVDKNGNPTPLIGKSSDQFDLTGSSGQLKALASAHNKNAQEIGDLKNLEHDQIRSIYADPVTAPASPTPGSSSTVSSVPHANSNGEILQRGGQDLTVVKAFNTLDSDILINHEDIIKLNDKTVKNTGEISDNKNNIAQNKSDINKLQSHSNSSAKHIQNNDKRITKNTQDIHHNTERINSVEAQMKKGIADAVAVAEIKYPKMEKGEMGIGAGYGTYESENAIAIGVGLQATDNLFINASVGATSGADDSVVGGAGVSYKFKVF